MTAPPPRFARPAAARARLRLAAALGLLAATALVLGTLASLLWSKQPEPPRHRWVQNPDPETLIDPTRALEQRVQAAEHSVAEARAALRQARERGDVDPTVIDGLERRLGLLGESPVERIRRELGPPPKTDEPPAEPHLRDLSRPPREL